jgi:hypothetical protein
VTWVDNVSCGVANGQTTANYYNESRQYNTRLKLTQLCVTPTGGAQTPLNITHRLLFGGQVSSFCVERSSLILARVEAATHLKWKISAAP